MRIIGTLLLTVFMLAAHAGSPLWTFTPLTATRVAVPTNATVTVQYLVTNQSSKSHTLIMNPISAVTQVTGGPGLCRAVFTLPTKGSSCTLSLLIDGSMLAQSINDGPIVCQDGSMIQCYRPSENDVLHITSVDPGSSIVLNVSGSPLTLNTSGPFGDLTLTNTSLTTTALNITSDFTGTALDGNVVETGNTCASVLPGSTCVLTYTPGSSAVPLTDFPISGTNTEIATAAIEINAALPSLTSLSPVSGPASGGSGVTLTGSNLTGATTVTFDGISAGYVNVVSSSTVTAVTPAHAVGAVDVTIVTLQGSSTLTNGYSYSATAVGQSADGGVIGCLGGGLDNLIASVSNNSSGIDWGGAGTTTNGQSPTDGSSNTATIVSWLGAGAYAAFVCANYEVDSQGNSPCVSGNACYDDWFLPAQAQLGCLYTNRVSIGGFLSSSYWSSTEDSFVPDNYALGQDFDSGTQNVYSKTFSLVVRCTRAFTP